MHVGQHNIFSYCDMDTTNLNNRECAQTSGTVYSKNSTFFSRVYHYCSVTNKVALVRKECVHLDMASCSDRIDYIEIVRKGDDVEIRVMFSGKTLYVWTPKDINYDLEDGFCFSMGDFTWHVLCMPSSQLLFDKMAILKVCSSDGKCTFCTFTSGFIEFPQENGSRWVNPSTKSILMPCDGRGGGIEPQAKDPETKERFSQIVEDLDSWCSNMEKQLPEKDEFARKVWTYATAKKIYKAHLSNKTKNIFFEPQVIDKLLGLLPGLSIVEGVQDIAKAVHNCAVNGMTIPHDIAVKLDQALGELADLNNNLDKVNRNGVSVTHSHELSLGNFFTWIVENRTTVGVFVLSFVIGCLLCFSSNKPLVLALCSIVGSFLLLNGAPEWIKERWDHIMHMIRGYNEGAFEPQMIDNPITKGLMLFGYLTVFKNLDMGTMTSRFEKIFSKLARAPAATEKFAGVATFYATALQSLLNETMRWIGVDKTINWFGDKYPEATALIKETEDFLANCAKDSKDLMVARAAQTSRVLQNQILNLRVKNKADKDFVGCCRMLHACGNRLQAFDKELELRGAGRSVTRIAPKAFLFMGKPGIGKSYLLDTLCTMLLYKLFANDPVALKRIDEKQTRDFIFTRNSDDKFWEGYYNQTIVYLDEVAMARDVAGSNSETNEYSMFVKMVNDVCFPLPMANVEKKGTCEFDSDFILGTTNASFFDIQSINNKDAYDRRWIKIEVEVDPKYGYVYNPTEANGTPGWYRPDFPLIETMMTPQEIALSSFLRFRERKSLFRTDEYIGDWMNIHDLMSRMKKEADDRERQKYSKKSHSEMLRDIFRTEPVAGAFEPQSNDCRCKVCTDEHHVGQSAEETFFYTQEMGMPEKVFWAAFKEGYEEVASNVSSNYSVDPVCIRKCIADYSYFDKIDVARMHGCHTKSAMLNKTKYDIIDEQVGWLKAAANTALAFLGFVLSSLATWKIIEYLCGNKSDETDWKLGADALENTSPQLKDLNAQEILSCILKRNVYAVGDNVISFRGFATFIKDNIFVVPKHYLAIWRADISAGKITEMTLRRLGDNVNHQVIRFDPSLFLRDDLVYCFENDEDLCAIYLDNRVMQKHASLRPYLMDTTKRHTRGEALLPRVDPKNFSYSTVSVPFSSAGHGTISYEKRGVLLKVNSPILYRFKTAVGDCGLPVAVKDPLARKEKIFGIHVSGSPSESIGVSSPLTQKHFDLICEHFSARYDLIEAQYRTDARALLEMEKENKNWNDLFSVPDELEVPGKVNLGYLEPPSVPVKTSIVPSPLFKKIGFDPKTKPAWLRPFTKDGVTIDPNAIATTKYHHSTEMFDLSVLDLCKNNVTDLILNSNMIDEDERMGRRVLTFRESVEGIAGVDGFDGIPRRTSAGYPRCKYVENKGKRDFFGDCDDYEFDNDKAKEIEESVENIIVSAKNNIRGNHVFLDFPKDERRPKLKADSGKTRKISACPLDLAICIRMYFGCFVQFFMKNRIFNQSAVGVNVFDKQWEYIAEYLGVENRVIAGDFSNYDGKLPYAVMIRFLDTVTDFYGDRGQDSERVREVLFQELVNSRHIMNGAIYEWVGSNASGNPLTTVLNSWCNLVLLRYAALKCVGKCNAREARPFLKSLDSHTRFMVYGDDNLISVRRDSEFAPQLTQKAFTEAFASMGLEYTDESKSGGEIDQDRSITDVSFLKRRWARHSILPGRKFLSPLELNTILESIQWTKKKDGLFEAVKDNVCNMLQELSQHDKQTFDEWMPKIVQACKDEMNFVPLPNTYKECQEAVLARDMSF